MFKVVLEALHSQRNPGAREFTVSRRCQRIDSNSSVNCFLEKLYRRSDEQRAVLPGVGTWQALDPALPREAFDITLGEWFVGWATHYEGYEGRNPRTGEIIKVPGTQMPSLFFGLSK